MKLNEFICSSPTGDQWLTFGHIYFRYFLYVNIFFVLYITKLQSHYVYSCACFLFTTLYAIDVLF